MQQRFVEQGAEQAERRIAMPLLRIMQHAGNRTEKGIRIDLGLSREDMAEFTGTTQYTVSRILIDRTRIGWIVSSMQPRTMAGIKCIAYHHKDK